MPLLQAQHAGSVALNELSPMTRAGSSWDPPILILIMDNGQWTPESAHAQGCIDTAIFKSSHAPQLFHHGRTALGLSSWYAVGSRQSEVGIKSLRTDLSHPRSHRYACLIGEHRSLSTGNPHTTSPFEFPGTDPSKDYAKAIRF
jgi:hypothetical protein